MRSDHRNFVVLVVLGVLAAATLWATPTHAAPGDVVFDGPVASGHVVPIGGSVPVTIVLTASSAGALEMQPCAEVNFPRQTLAHVGAGETVVTTVRGRADGSCLYPPPGHLTVTEVPMPDGVYHALDPVIPAFAGDVVVGSPVPVVPAGAGLPAADLTGVALHVSAWSTAATSLTVSVCGSAPPTVPSVGVTSAASERHNVVYLPLSAGDTICVATAVGTATVVVDIVGWFGAGAATDASPPIVVYGIGNARGPGLFRDSPRRILDTRTEGEAGRVGADPVRYLGVPVLDDGLSLNVTVTEAPAPGYLTVFGCDGPGGAPDVAPLSSNVNYVPGENVANAVIVATGASAADPTRRFVCLVSQVPVHVVVDRNGSFRHSGGDGLRVLEPARIVDTRDGTGRPAPGPVGRDSVIEVQVAGRGGVPASGARAVALNVTATETTAPGYVTVWPCGEDRPLASSLNYNPPGPGRTTATRANLALVTLPASGRVCLYSQEPAHLVIDTVAYFEPRSPYGLVATGLPRRDFDTRLPTPAAPTSITPTPPSGFVIEQVASFRPFPVYARVLNVTAVDGAAEGYLTAYGCPAAPPYASTVNLDPPRAVPNLTIVRTVTSYCIRASVDTHVVADALGTFTTVNTNRAPMLVPGPSIPT